MKKLLAILLSVCIMLSVSSCGLIQKIKGGSEPSGTTAESTTATEETAAETIAETEIQTEPATEAAKVDNTEDYAYVGDYVGVYYETSVDYTDGVGNHYNADFVIPELKMSSSDALEANDEIREECKKWIDESVEASKKKYSLICTEVSYEAWFNGRLLTLITTIKLDVNQIVYYMVYTFDVTTGEELDNEDIAEQVLKISEDELELKIKDAMLNYFVDNCNTTNKDDIYYEQLEQTISEDNIDDAEVYLDKSGNAYIHCVIYSIAGAGSYEHLIKLD